jgi:hydroxymethylpyrimidine/phosphomethylpyrimidine kinase
MAEAGAGRPDAERPQLLIISGLDPSGGAGFIADVRVAERLGVRPVGVVTALTEQNSLGVRAANPVSAEAVSEQLTSLLTDVQVDAVKIGMLGSEAIARAVAEALALTSAPVVWDPVLAATAGVPLYDGDFVVALTAILPHVALLTPNGPEAAVLSGLDVRDLDGARQAAQVLRHRGVAAVLVKGGHLGGGDDAEAIDLLVDGGGELALRGPRQPQFGRSVHGTGCALSTAIACGLARGLALAEACRAAKDFVAARIADPVSPGRGAASVF